MKDEGARIKFRIAERGFDYPAAPAQPCAVDDSPLSVAVDHDGFRCSDPPSNKSLDASRDSVFSHEAFVNQHWRYREAASTLPFGCY